MAKTPVIAIVDDDEGVRTSLASLVRSIGYEAQAYESGMDFLRQAPGDDPACMIADVQMPVRAGPGCLDSAPLDLSGFLPGYAERGALRFCRCVGRA
ncbi:response regulator [Bradyrhizobium diazoefficiens]|uniref:response regulator n=1 Tax=Bradyrhizobium diazoefficiens TaxID=1355477 RepID=UPI003F73EB62